MDPLQRPWGDPVGFLPIVGHLTDQRGTDKRRTELFSETLQEGGGCLY